MQRIDKKGVQKLLTAVLNKVGPKHTIDRDKGCIYFEQETATDEAGDEFVVEVSNRPCCIVGHAAAMTGNADLISLLRSNNDESIDSIDGIEEHFTPGAIGVLDLVQLRQDQGWEWGKAVAQARTL